MTSYADAVLLCSVFSIKYLQRKAEFISTRCSVSRREMLETCVERVSSGFWYALRALLVKRRNHVMETSTFLIYKLLPN